MVCVAGAGIAVVTVVCVGFLVFLVILGVARLRSTQRRTVEVNMEERQEMEWDNSALNITVNPLDHEVLLLHTDVRYYFHSLLRYFHSLLRYFQSFPTLFSVPPYIIFSPSLRYFQSLTITATLHRLDMFTNDNNELGCSSCNLTWSVMVLWTENNPGDIQIYISL